MKHLYEFSNYYEYEKIEKRFLKWFHEKGLTKVDLPDENDMNCIEQSMGDDEYYYIVNIHGYSEIWITAEWVNKNGRGIDSWSVAFWDGDTLDEVWNYLQSLTPEQIDQMKAEQESEKFNM